MMYSYVACVLPVFLLLTGVASRSTKLLNSRDSIGSRYTSAAEENSVSANPSRVDAGKFINLFTLIRFDNYICDGSTTESGVCLTSKECKNRGGSASKSCASGFGVCCEVVDTCGGETSDKVSYFQNPSYPITENSDQYGCAFTVNIEDHHCCQVRIDFQDFELDPPLDDTGTSSSCIDGGGDMMTITGNGLHKTGVPALCGYNTGQHMFLHLDTVEIPTAIQLMVVSDGQENDLWRIKITQINCHTEDHLMAPPDCLQYFTETYGTITNLGYDEINVYPPNLNYAVCIKREPEVSCLQYSINTFDIPCGTPRNNDDFIIIPNNDANNEEGPLNCGTDIQDGDILDSDLGGPYYIQFHSDSVVNTGELGFSLDYQLFTDNDCSTPASP